MAKHVSIKKVKLFLTFNDVSLVIDC